MKTETKNKILYISTFGIAYLIANKKAKNHSNNKNKEIKKPTAENFELDKFIDLFGGINNIIDAIATISSLKIVCKHPINIDQNIFKKMGAKGSVVSQNKTTILFGDISYDIATQIKSRMANK